MDRDALAEGFRSRLTELLEGDAGGKAAFLRDTGLDRSALGQFLSPGNLRLPRAESLRAIAEARGVSVDWLLCIETAPSGRQEVTASIDFAEAGRPDLLTPLDCWKREVAGMTIRYAPSTIPDILGRPELRRGPQDDALLQMVGVRDPHLEIALGFEMLHSVAHRTGLWRHLTRAQAAAQLTYMAGQVEAGYPATRVHLFDGRELYSPAFTVFGQIRAALFLGEGYMVVTSAEQIETFTAKFDSMVRRAITGPDRVPALLCDLAAEAGDAP